MKSLKHRLAFALIMGAVTTALISFTLIFINLGFGSRFMTAWLRSWAISYVLGVSLMISIAPGIQHLVSRFFANDFTTEKDS
jgi:hypothetical protein